MGKRINYRNYLGHTMDVTLVKRDKSCHVVAPEFQEYTTSWLRRIGARETVHPEKRFGVTVIPHGVTEIYVLDNRDGELFVFAGTVPANVYRTFWVLNQDAQDVIKAHKA